MWQLMAARLDGHAVVVDGRDHRLVVGRDAAGLFTDRVAAHPVGVGRVVEFRSLPDWLVRQCVDKLRGVVSCD